SAGLLAVPRPERVSAGSQDAKVFEGRKVFDRLVTQARERRWSERPIGERIGAIGMALRQTPYVASTLELYDDREVCAVDFRGLDCVTFFELALAFARILKRGEPTADALLADVTLLRYRGGQLTDYASRLRALRGLIPGRGRHSPAPARVDHTERGRPRRGPGDLRGERADAQRCHGGPSAGSDVALGGAVRGAGHRSRSITTTSTHWPSSRPCSRYTPTSTNPSRR